MSFALGPHAPPRPNRGLTRGLRAALVVVLATVTALATTAGAESGPGPAGEGVAAELAAPSVVPALRDWQPQPGEYQFDARSRVLYPADSPELRPTARTLARELEAQQGGAVPVVPRTERQRAGDVVLALDPGHTDLGDEGYELVVDDVVRVTGGTETGAFYGTRTVLQLLAESPQAPKGRTADVPRYSERGAAVCPCEIKISMPRMERLMQEMAYLKLNFLLLPLKVESDSHPEANKWSYYTKDEARQIAELAAKYHITVVPEINAPGHMEPFLFDRPDLQLADVNGDSTSRRIDITKPEAFDFYTDLVDEYFEIFPGPYWHMGADEYMLHSAYENYPQIGKYAREKFGPDAVPADAFIDFVNRVNDYVGDKHDKTLRIWNDGLPRENIIAPNEGPHPRLDTDIIIHHWKGSYVAPSEFADAGYTLMNAADSLYEDRGGKLDLHDMCPEANRLAECVETMWAADWSPGEFEGDGQLDPGHHQLTGAHLSLWQTVPHADTENQMEQAIFMPLRFLAQRTWGSTEQFETYAEFTDRAQRIGDPPAWGNLDDRPLADGTYTIRLAERGRRALAAQHADVGSELVVGKSGDQWQFRHTEDGYYRIVSTTTGRCVDMETADGLALLEGEPGVGEAATVQPCSSSNTQKWEVTEGQHNGYTITNAISQLPTTVASDGAVVQIPPDQVDPSGWKIEIDAAATVQIAPEDELLEPGERNDVTVSFTNHDDKAVRDLRLTLAVPAGWDVKPDAGAVYDTVESGATAEATFAVTPPQDAAHSTDHKLEVDASYRVGPVPVEVSAGKFVRIDPIVCSQPETQPVDPNDEFDGTGLDGCRWTAVQDPSPADLQVADGWLHIETQDGDLAGGPPDIVNNLLLQDAPNGDWTAEVKIDAPLSEQYQQAGLMVHGDNDNFVEFVLVANNPADAAPELYYSLVSEVNGEFGHGGAVNEFDLAGDDDDIWWLRMHKRGDTYTAEYSADSESWVAMPGEVVNDSIEDPKVGLFATWSGVTVGFDHFHLSGSAP